MACGACLRALPVRFGMPLIEGADQQRAHAEPAK
jgi:hypothetical protein